jgi:hypothetical protein
MAINFDHTNSANITLKGPDATYNHEAISFLFPNTDLANAYLLVSGEAPIASISGLTSALGAKANTADLGTAAYVDTGIVEGTLPVLDQYGKLVDSVIPSLAIRDIFEITNSSDRTTLSDAQLGDVAISSADKENWILAVGTAGAYATSSNWKKIQFIDQVVTSVNSYCGDVVINSSDISSTSGYYIGQTVNYALEDLYTVKADVVDLNDYYTKSEVNSCLSLYEKTCDLNTTLCDYTTCSAFTTCISNYSTTSQISQCLSDNYVPQTETGSAASKNVGTDVGDVVEIGNGGKISTSILPRLAITDTFIINTSGSLTGLVDAEQGDLAIATGELLNYILQGTDYSQISDWVALAAPLGTVNKVNGIEPVNGDVLLDSSDIYVQNSNTVYDNQTITDALSGIYADLDTISGSYLTVTYATGLLNGYVTTGAATGAFNTKSDVGHGHVIADITGLGDCLTTISTFYTGAGTYSATQYASNNLMNEANGLGSLALGYKAKANQDYEIAHAAGAFANVGDAQASKIVFKKENIGSSLETLASISLDDDSTVLFNAYVIGRGAGKYAAYKVEGAAGKDSTSASAALLDDANYNIFVNTDDSFYLEAVANTTNGTLDLNVSGEAGMKWVASVNVVKAAQ